MSGVDRDGDASRADASATSGPSLNAHRPVVIRDGPYRGGKLGRVLGVGCSAVRCRWGGPSVEDFYRDHLYPMIPKIGERSSPRP